MSKFNQGPNDGTSTGSAETARRFKLKYNSNALKRAEKELARNVWFESEIMGAAAAEPTWEKRRNYWLDVCGHINGDFPNP